MSNLSDELKDLLKSALGTPEATNELVAAIEAGASGGSGDIKSDGSVDFLADQSMGGFKITDVEDPSSDQDVATKKYVDDNSGGSPGGSDKQVQFNDGGSTFGGNAQFTFDKVKGSATVGDTIVASGVNTFATGLGVRATVDLSQAMGYSDSPGTKGLASGLASHMEGWNGVASGTASHAQGYDTRATGDFSHAAGQSTLASGTHSHAGGVNTVASGVHSTAIGSGTLASGADSTALGFETIAASDDQLAIGTYNVSVGTPGTPANTDEIFTVGIGASSGARANAIAVLRSGELIAPNIMSDKPGTQHTLSIFSNDQTNQESGRIQISSGSTSSVSDVSGDLRLTTGDTDDGNSGALTFISGYPNGDGASGGVVLVSNDTDNAGGTGGISIQSGGCNGTGASGTLDFRTGYTSGNVNSGNAQIVTGPVFGTSIQSGGILIATGSASGGTNSSSGNVEIRSGAKNGSGVRGDIRFVNGSEGTAGQYWISTDVNGTGHWSAPADYSARAHGSSTTISGSLATIVYGTEDFDASSSYDNSTGIYTAPVTGKYQVNASLLIAGTIALNNTLIMEIQKNSSVYSRCTVYLPGALTDGSIEISDIVNCSATDTIRIQVSTSSTSPSIASSNFDNYISIAKIS